MVDAMKILLSSHACEPHRGSEEGVGWNTAVESAKYCETWVLTRPQYRKAIEDELAVRPIPQLNFIYFEVSLFEHIHPWRFDHLSGQLHYYLWQIQAYFVAKKLHEEVQFSLIRHVTYVKYWSPSFLALLPPVFIWGPVGGAEAAPRTFWRDFSPYGKRYEFLRFIAQRIGELDPFTRLTAHRSALALATTKDTADRLKHLGVKCVEIFPETGLSLSDIEGLAVQPLPPEEPIRFLSLGRLLHWKGHHLSIKAFHEANIPNAEYWIVGTGAERQRLEALCQGLGLEGKVKFFGLLPRDETLEKLSKCHILVHPSLHDSGGWTCLEGMAARRPVICLDLGGPLVQVTEETGLKIPAHNPEQAIEDMAKAMIQLARDSDLRLRLGEAGHFRVKTKFNWLSIGYSMAETYQKSLSDCYVKNVEGT